jgi:hypothetical protein
MISAMSYNPNASYVSTMTRFATSLALLFCAHGFTSTSLTRLSPRARPASSLALPYQLGPPVEHQDKEGILTTSILTFEDLGRVVASNARPTSTSGLKIHPSAFTDSKPLPLTIEPRSDNQSSLSCLKNFLSSSQQWVDRAVLNHGAVLFGGFPIHTAR